MHLRTRKVAIRRHSSGRDPRDAVGVELAMARLMVRSMTMDAGLLM